MRYIFNDTGENTRKRPCNFQRAGFFATIWLRQSWNIVAAKKFVLEQSLVFGQPAGVGDKSPTITPMAANDIILVFLIRSRKRGCYSPFRRRQQNHITINMKFRSNTRHFFRYSPSPYSPSSNKLIRSIGHSDLSCHLSYRQISGENSGSWKWLI